MANTLATILVGPAGQAEASPLKVLVCWGGPAATALHLCPFSASCAFLSFPHDLGSVLGLPRPDLDRVALALTERCSCGFSASSARVPVTDTTKLRLTLHIFLCWRHWMLMTRVLAWSGSGDISSWLISDSHFTVCSHNLLAV